MRLQLSYVPFIAVLLLDFLSCGSEKSGQDRITISLDRGWRFRNVLQSRWLPAEVPGCVQTDLFRLKIIPDPFDRNNETKLQWIGEKDWIYETTFQAGPDLRDKRNLVIRFQGVDTYALVTLNGYLILRTDNMFREWTAAIKPYLKSGNNILRVRFRSPLTEDSLRSESAYYPLPDSRGFTRKAPYQYGWDWGPRFITMGIWRPVQIIGWDYAIINDFQMIQKSLSDKAAVLDAVFEIQSQQAYSGTIRLILDEDLNSTIESQVDLKQGLNRIAIPFHIDHPKRWWPNGLGEPYLYRLQAEMMIDGNPIDKTECNIGLRTVQLIREKDTFGESFFFKVNGIPVFMKGANVIPLDNFLPRISGDRYRSLIKSVKDAHMNMLRVWGGGIYEDDLFYHLCDENGILVWQDFMFACNLYPGDMDFLENVRQEAVENIRRLRNHPCLALWCGNNEVNEGWYNWGWKERYSKDQANLAWNNYTKLFHEILPEAVRKKDPGRPYWPSSPKIGWGHPESLREGDCHYWGVWWGKEPFDIYQEKVGRFMTEYGFQGFPPLETIRSFTLPDDRYLESPVLEGHQKNPEGFGLIETYMKRDFPVPEDFDDYVYVSQILQAEGIRTAIEAHRRAKPACMGTLYWQLNDCWPVISWSSLDYSGRWKALHYAVKRAYREVLVSPVLEDNKVKVYVVSDRIDPFSIILFIQLMTFDGKVIWEKSISYEMPAKTSQLITELKYKNLIEDSNLNQTILFTAVYEGEKVLSENQLFFLPPKALKLRTPKIQWNLIKHPKGVLIELSSNILARYIRLDCQGQTDHFSDNYFDLLPGQTVRILYAGPASFLRLSKHLIAGSLADVK